MGTYVTDALGPYVIDDGNGAAVAIHDGTGATKTNGNYVEVGYPDEVQIEWVVASFGGTGVVSCEVQSDDNTGFSSPKNEGWFVADADGTFYTDHKIRGRYVRVLVNDEGAVTGATCVARIVPKDYARTDPQTL